MRRYGRARSKAPGAVLLSLLLINLLLLPAPPARAQDYTPQVTGISPDQGGMGGGYFMTITGSGFAAEAQGQVEVAIGGVAARVVARSETELKVEVPPRDPLPAAPVPVVVANVIGGQRYVAEDPPLFTYLPGPIVDALVPNFGSSEGGAATGRVTLVLGKNFTLTGYDGLEVRFGEGEAATPAEVLDRQSTFLRVYHPPGAYTGLPVAVTVRLSGSGVVPVETRLNNAFIYAVGSSNPRIVSVSPNVLPSTGGEIMVGGQDFRSETEADGLTPRLAALYLVRPGYQYAAEVLRLRWDEIRARVPALPAGVYDLKVVNPDGRQAVLSAAVTIKAAEQALRLVSITPNRGSVEGGVPVTLKVVNLPPGWQSVGLEIGGIPASEVNVKDANTIEARVPERMAPGAYDVALRVTYQEEGQIREQVSVLPQGFTYVIPTSSPSVTFLAPNSGPLAGGTEVTINGSDFRAPQEGQSLYVFFGLRLARSVRVVDASTLVAVIPEADAPGAVDVTVVNPDGGTAVLPLGFTYLGNPPYLTSITPAFGTKGTPVVIAAANLTVKGTAAEIGEIRYDALGNPIEWFENLPIQRLEELSAGAWRIYAEIPALVPGPKLVRVRTPYGVSNYLDFQYLPATYPAPVVTSVDPDKGPARGGVALAVYGENFQSGARVYLGDKELNGAVVESVHKISGRTPAGLLPGASYPVRVVNPDGREGTLADAFYVYSEPQVTQVTPATGSVDGGNIITVKGQEFYPGALVRLEWKAIDESGQTVTGFVYAKEVTVRGTTELRFRLPPAQDASGPPLVLKPGEECQVDLVVINRDGGSFTLVDGFTYRGPQVTPSIASVTPPWGPTEGGIEILVSGSGFLPGARVFIGWEAAKVVQVGPTLIRAVIPAQPEGKYDVSVMNDLDGGAAVLRSGFEYRQPRTQPKITSIYPNRGPNYRSTLVTLRGENFWPGAEVFFGSSVAKAVYYVDTTVLKVYTPEVPDYVGPVDVRLVDPYGGVALVRNGFTFTQPAAGYLPVIEALSPREGSTQGGTPVVITGRNFFQGAEVYFDGLPSPSVKVLDTGTVVAESPPHAPGAVEVTLVNWDGGAATYHCFIYRQPGTPPEILKVDPSVGRAREETPVTITGRNFQPGAKVYFGHTEAVEGEVKDYYTIAATAPALPAGKVDVRVVNPDFGEAVLRNGFTYQSSVPKITAVNPSQGRKEGGYTVAILGEDFRPPSEQAALRVFFGTQEVSPADITYQDEGTVAVKVPPSSRVGPVDVRLINPDGAEAVLKNGFMYTSPASDPEVTGVTPDKGPTTGGIWVTISGSDLREEARVYFGSLEALKVRFVDNQTLLALLPPQPVGPVAVTVVNYDGGTATKEAAFIYVIPESSPRIDRVVPNKGPHVGGTSITIYGLDFRSGATVYIDGAAATQVQVKSYKEIAAVAPPGRPGARDVTVINPDQGTYTASGAFTYVEVKVPSISKVEPDRGPKQGGTAITITGTNFASGAKVYIGGNEASEVKVTGGTQISAVAPAGEQGWRELKVVNLDGGFASLAKGFLYLGPPGEPGWLSARPVDETTVRLDWEEVEFASAYEIFVARDPGGPYAFLDRTIATTYYATGLVADQDYFFRVRAVNDLGLSVFSGEAWSRTEEKEEEAVSGELVRAVKGNHLYVTIPSSSAWRSLGSTLDLTAGAYAGVRGVSLRVPVDVALSSARTLTVAGYRFKLEIPAGGFRPVEARRLTASERQRSALVLRVEEVPAAEAGELARAAPGRVVSRLWRLEMRLEIAGQNRPILNLDNQVLVTITFDPALAGSAAVGLYRYRPDRGWERLGGQSLAGWPQVGGASATTGVFAAVADR
ncbi:MAG: IPT/TIG domain-containing protein [Moorellales bacterium]